MKEVFKRQIVKYVMNRDYVPESPENMAQAMGLSSKEFAFFREALDEMLAQGALEINSRGKIVTATIGGKVVGKFRANRKGFGFVTPVGNELTEDIFVGAEDTMGAMTGDIVLVKSSRKGFKGEVRYYGQVIEIVERGKSRIVGTLNFSKGNWYVAPDGNDFTEIVWVDDVGAKGGRIDDKVVVDIVEYPDINNPARGAIVEILGRAGMYDAELKSIIASYDLPGDFDEECLDQARDAGRNFMPDKAAGRDDITDEMIITIDPESARDFDDAISLRRNKDGNWVLGVHIADVSEFIPMDSPLDQEASDRGNSVYLPGKVIPMLPEILSNGICSLQPNQKRFAKSVYIGYDDEGRILGREYANSVIMSKCRLTYEQANDIIMGKASGFDPNVVSLLKDMEHLARAIERRRIKNGMIHLDLPETELIFDDEGKIVDAQPADDSYPHTIIEMFMVEANDAVAELLDRFNVPFMRRIHPEPDLFSIKRLGKFIRVCNMKLPRKLDRPAIQDLLKKVKGTPIEYAMNMYVLRSFERAEYSSLNMGHFALASRHYCHFTSPIRRYADLLVHRLFQCYLDQKLNMIGLEEVLPELVLREVARHINLMEERATEAEREMKKVLILQMLEDRIGDELDCVVSGVTNFGVFVQCRKFGIEGLIPLEQLGDDVWKFDERSQAIIGKNSGRSVGMGRLIKARIVRVDVQARLLDLAPSEPVVKRSDYARKGRGKGFKLKYGKKKSRR